MMSVMETASPFAPSRRNAFFHILPENHGRVGQGTFVISVALLVLVGHGLRDSPCSHSRAVCSSVCACSSSRRRIEKLCKGVAVAMNTMIMSSPVGSLGRRRWIAWFDSMSQDRPVPVSLSEPEPLDNYRLIRSVLMFWFGKFTPDLAQKKLWMIAASSEKQRLMVDEHIALNFGRFILGETYTQWDLEIYGYQGKLAAIIVLDQFSRHIHRHYASRQACAPSSLPQQTKLDELAFAAAENFLKVHRQEINCGMISLPMVVFALMPYRHAGTLQKVQFVQQSIEDLSSIGDQCNSMLSRFRKATNRRMAVLQDEARRIGDGTHVDASDLDILETHPFDADLDPACSHVVHKTIVSFLNSRGIQKGGPIDRKPFPVIVSLSGGVDSMVIASVLAHLANGCNYNIKVFGIHIDYANRPESAAEADYVQRYCEGNGIHFCLRRIDEVTRGIDARDDYERIAREARYNSYRETVRLCKDENGDTSLDVGVMLGHHRGDLRENVLSNAHKGCGPLDLSGMTQVSMNDRVCIYRPLLSLEKKAIFDYAHQFGVPYFKDTTPHWSTRGKLRNKLVPLLQEIYGEGSMNNLSNLAVESDQARELLQSAVLGPFLHQVERFPLGIAFHTQPWKDQGIFFWKFVLREALHKSSLGMFSDKSVEAFLERVQCATLKEGWLQCRRDYAVFLRNDGRVFILFPDSFPFQKAQQFHVMGRSVPYGEEVKVGPWSITATVLRDECVDKLSLLEKKAIPSWDSFMNGEIRYFIEVPIQNSIVRPLVFVSEFAKQSRPRAWRGSELKIQATLPVLGNDTDGVQELSKGSSTAMVNVVLQVAARS